MALVSTLLSFALAAGGGDADDFPDPDVIKLTDATFHSQVDSAEIALVEFYAPWCGHCKHLAPEYAKAATELKKEDPPVPLMKLDATKHEKSASAHGVQGYPTLKVFRKGVAEEYKGPRDAAGIVAYMRSISGPASKPFTDGAAASRFVAFSEATGKGAVETSDCVHFLLSRSESSAAAKAFHAVANALRDKHRFAHTYSADVATALGVDNAAGDIVVSFRGFDDRRKPFAGPWTEEAVREFVKGAAIATVAELSPDVEAAFREAGTPSVVVFGSGLDAKRAPKQRAYVVNRIKRAAAQLAAAGVKMTFALGDRSAAGDIFGSKGGDVVFYVRHYGQGKKYVPEDPTFSTEAVVAFATKAVAGEVEPTIKSAPIPTEKDDGVTVVVGKNFADVVQQDDKDVMLEMYAPWCGHCKALAPEYAKLAKGFAGVDSVVIAKMDMTTNESPNDEYTAAGYPTIYFKAAGAALPLKYQGERKAKAMREWIIANGAAAATKAAPAKPPKAAKGAEANTEL